MNRHFFMICKLKNQDHKQKNIVISVHYFSFYTIIVLYNLVFMNLIYILI